jgi:transcription initiation factor TFIID TATA-box-binding protein
MVCTGARNEYAAIIALNLFYWMVKSLHPEARFSGQMIQNMVSSASLGAPVRIDEMAKAIGLQLVSNYEPEIFPGFRLAISKPKVKALIFAAGKVVITGAKNRDDIAKAWAAITSTLGAFLTGGENGLPALRHADIIALKMSTRKRKIGQ